MADVTIVGAGIAGLSAALRLLERGFSVEVLEQNDFVGGKWGAHRTSPQSPDCHEHCYHMMLNWYRNMWDIVDQLGLRQHFLPVHELGYLRAGDFPNTTAMRDVGAPETAIPNVLAGVLSPPDAFIYAYSLIDLLGQPFVRSDLLDQYSVNGFMHSRSYATPEAARQHHRTLAKAFAAPSYATAASTYRNFIRYGFRDPVPMMWMLDGNSHDVVFQPLLDELESFGEQFTLKPLQRLKRLAIENGRVTSLEVEEVASSPSVADGQPVAVQGTQHLETPGDVILAVPPGALGSLVDADLFAAAPELAGVKKLKSEPMASIDLYFRQKLANIPRGIVVLMNARFELTFVDNSQLWPDQKTTFLNIIASEFDELTSLPSHRLDEAGRTVIDLDQPRSALEYILIELQRYLPFAPADIDLDRLYIQTNVGEELMVNAVGSWQYRPSTTCRIPNLFIAGDHCRTPVDAVTIEGAITSGLMAAEAIRKRHGKGAPITIHSPEAYPEAAMAALAAVGLPYAYGAKLWAMAGEEAWRTYEEFLGED